MHHQNCVTCSMKNPTTRTKMAAKSIPVLLLFSSSLLVLSLKPTSAPDPSPSPWPLQFHSVLFMNNTKGTLQVTDLWYDWPNGRNFNIIQNQLGDLTYDLEWDNGTSYIYTDRGCRVLGFPVGVLRPDWLAGATYLGRRRVDGFLCNVWEKVDFIWYYEDVVSKRPVYWVFFTGMVAHVMTFEVGAVLEDVKWQAPTYCFEDAKEKGKSSQLVYGDIDDSYAGRFMRGAPSIVSAAL